MSLSWEEIKLGIKEELSDQVYRLWIKPLKVIQQSEEGVVLVCPNRFARDWIADNYLDYLKQKFQEAGVRAPNLILEVECPGPQEFKEPGIKVNHQSLPIFQERVLNSYYTFENFVVGPCNQFAYSVSKALAETSLKDYRLLLMLAHPGLGKTHLAKAIGNYITRSFPSLRVCYVTAEEFTTDMVRSIKTNRVEEFKERFRKECDVFLLEELHFLNGKPKTQAELGHTVEALLNANKTIVITSCLPPKDMPNINKDLSSRLSLSLIASIDKPDLETRLKITRLKAKEMGLNLGRDIIETIAKKVKKDIRDIECVLRYLKAKSQLLNIKINSELVDEILAKISQEEDSITLSQVEELVCRYFKITPEELRSKSRKKNHVFCRSVFAYLSRRLTKQTIEAISNYINRKHSTIIYGLECLERDMARDIALKEQLGFLEGKLRDKWGHQLL